jgi:prepilin-type N-terminal cleavage/methylation domain-containing protein/prepilin-type processing-associated H-X9-DG protein
VFDVKMPRGFTLTEMLVVITIIAILGSMMMPVFMRARDKAHQVQCISNLRQLGMAATMYKMENEGYPSSNWAGYRNPVTQIFDIENGGLFSCARGASIYHCPSDMNGRTYGLSYEMNKDVMGELDDLYNVVLFVEAGVDDGTFDIGSLSGEDPIPVVQEGAHIYDIPNPMNAVHNGSTSDVVFTDGHARAFRAGTLKAGMFKVEHITLD